MQRVYLLSLSLFVMTVWQTAIAVESLDYSIARGGKLYDKWYKTNSTGTPKGANPAYPDSGKYKGKKGSDWRCKECHGWDYLGKNGAYSKGKHFTGIDGVLQAGAKGETDLKALLRNKNHGYTAGMLTERDIADLSNFIRKGMLDMDRHINRETGKVTGDVNRGASYYQTICAGCHGLDGKKEEEAPPLGKLSHKNPWETLHKIRNGQPGSEMPSMQAFDIGVSVDILAYLQTLPKE